MDSMNLNGKRLVVTGASGFVGSHLTEALLAAGASVRAFIRYNSGHRIGHLEELPAHLRGSLSICLGDLRDLEAVRTLVSEAETVFHLGALGSVPYSYQDPLAFVDVNVTGTTNVLRACIEYKVSRLVLMSTSEVYGSAQYIPIDEAHPLRAQSPYAASKIAAEKFAESFGCSYGLPVTIVRGFNIYGPRQSRRNVIPALLGQALTGSTIRVGYLDSIRDYTYVTDSVRAVAELAFDEKASGRVINVGSGKGYSVEDLINIIMELTGKQFEIVVDQARLRPPSSEVRKLVASTAALTELIGWGTRIPMDTGLGLVMDWLREHPDNHSGIEI
jgi:nucleoside-diphosphate-sugar epimerase